MTEPETPAGLDVERLTRVLHALLPMEPGKWRVWQADQWGGGHDRDANSSEFADLILERLAAYAEGEPR
jgi:hypothetical protein